MHISKIFVPVVRRKVGTKLGPTARDFPHSLVRLLRRIQMRCIPPSCSKTQNVSILKTFFHGLNDFLPKNKFFFGILNLKRDQ